MFFVDFSDEFVYFSSYNIYKEFLDNIFYMNTTFVVIDLVLKFIKMNRVGNDKKVYKYPFIQFNDL